MTDLHDYGSPVEATSGRHQDYPDINNHSRSIDHTSEQRYSRAALWVGGALVVAAVIAVAGYALNANRANNDATNTSTTDSTAANQFTEAESDGMPDSVELSPSEVVNDVTASPERTRGEIIRAADGSFINYISTWDLAGDPERTDAMRSTDGENWEPVQMTGLPPGLLVEILHNDDHYFATVSGEVDTPSTLAASADGLNWITLANPEPPSSPNYKHYIEPENAARLADGRYLVEGTPYSQIDFEALGIDPDNICGYGDENEEVLLCDGTSQTLNVAWPEPEASITWTVDAAGLNPSQVSASEGLESDLALLGGSDDQEASYNGSTYRITEDGDGTQRIERSDDGGASWNATVPLGDSRSIELVAAGPAGVVAVTEDYLEGSTYGSDAFYDAINSIRTSINKDGYELRVSTVDGLVATYSLVGLDGAELLSGSFDDASNPSGDGVEVLHTAVPPGMRFFDPATGQDYVTFTAIDVEDGLKAAANEAAAKVSVPFTVTQDGYTLQGTVPTGEWKVSNSDGAIITTFASPIFASYWNLDTPTSAADEAVRSVDPLTKDVTVMDNGAPVVTFTYDGVVGALGRSFVSRSEGAIYFSADQGATWQELSRINGWVLSLVVGANEVLVMTDSSSTTPIRLPLTAAS